MFLVTGGVGFIGSNIVRELNRQGEHDIIVVDNLINSAKLTNLYEVRIADYFDKKDFLEKLISNKFDYPFDGIIHLGACSDTMSEDANYVMQNNFQYSKVLFQYSIQKKIPFIYASSASVYGNSKCFTENEPACENPNSIYAYSKLLFDWHVLRSSESIQSPVVGLRYFNVYGPGESHKGKMASIIYQFWKNLKTSGVINVFKGSHGYSNGEHQRDFCYIRDVVLATLFFLNYKGRNTIINVGTGENSSFNKVAQEIIQILGQGKIEYIEMPTILKHTYQAFTKADLRNLRNMGYEKSFIPLEEGISEYIKWLESHNVHYLFGEENK